MPPFPNILDRFRRFLAPPGHAAPALGVPASGADVEAELGPLLARLEDVDAEARRLEDDAREEARSRRERAERESAVILEQAQSQAAAERVRAVMEHREAAQRDVQALRDDARRGAQRIRDRRDEKVDELVAEVLACVRQAGP